MIRALNILIVLLSILAAWLWNTDADGAQIFRIEGHRVVPQGGDPLTGGELFAGDLEVADSFLSLTGKIKYASDPTIYTFDLPYRFNATDMLPNGLDYRIFSAPAPDTTALTMIDQAAGASLDPLSLTDWDNLLLRLNDGQGASITSAVPVNEPGELALVAVGACGFLFCLRAIQGRT